MADAKQAKSAKNGKTGEAEPKIFEEKFTDHKPQENTAEISQH